MRILGLDLSLTSTGYVLLDEDFVVWHGAVGSKDLRDVERLRMFDTWIRRTLLENRLTHVAIEGYSYGSPFNATGLGELGGVVKVAIHQVGLPIHIIPPKTWRKVLCGNGNIKKHDVSKELLKRHGVDFVSLDTAEAWGVAMCLRRQLLHLDDGEPKARKRTSAPLPLLELSTGNVPEPKEPNDQAQSASARRPARAQASQAMGN